MPAISIRNLGKRYRVNHAVERAPYRTLRDSLSRAATAPIRRLRGEASGTSEDFWALKAVEFDVQPGEVVGIIGRNGAGKSTLLKILSRITGPTTGEVILNGRVGSLLEVGTGFHPELTGRENVYMNGSILGMTGREIGRKFDEIVAFAEVERFLDTPVKRYSSGMYVRLAFSVAAHLDPELLLVDEVLAVGDGPFQEKCLGKLSDMGACGRTVILVSHNMHAISKLANRALLLEGGKVVAFGETTDVMAQYLGPDDCRDPEWRPPTSRPGGAIQVTRVLFWNPSAPGKTTVNADNGFQIAIDLTVSHPSLAQIAFRLNCSHSGQTVFTSAHCDHLDSKYTRFACGRYRATCNIPGHLLRPGRYHILVAVNNPIGDQHYLIERAFGFEVVPVGSLVALDGRLGVFAPLFDWEVKRGE